MSKQDRGFASMDPEQQRRIASKGGKAAHKLGRAHEWTVDTAREAGRKGGSARRKKAAAASPDAAPATSTPTPHD